MSTDTTVDGEPAEFPNRPDIDPWPAWEHLARQCRQLADMAEQAGATLTQAGQTVGATPHDEYPAAVAEFAKLAQATHDDIGQAVQAVRAAAGGFRRDTYQTLRTHMTVRQMAEVFGVSKRPSARL